MVSFYLNAHVRYCAALVSTQLIFILFLDFQTLKTIGGVIGTSSHPSAGILARNTFDQAFQLSGFEEKI